MSLIERYLPLGVRPGVYNQGTIQQGKGRWIDAHLVRWYEGTMGPIGGWVAIIGDDGNALPTIGYPRAAYAWKDNSIQSWMAVGSFGTTCGELWLYGDHAVTDITPNDLVCGAKDGAYASGGYGSGGYGGGGYGVGISGTSTTLVPADTWTLDNYGQDLIACYTADGRLLQADVTGSDAAPITNSPTGCVAVVVTPEGFIVALGGSGFVDATPSPRRIRWADVDDPTYWTIDSTHSAGEIDLGSRGRLIAGKKTRRQTILWTDVDAYAMTFVGGDAVYAIEQIGDNCGIVGSQAGTTIGDAAFWMSNTNKFFLYDGAVRALDCDVLDYVFSQIEPLNRTKVQAVANTGFDEVIWFYPSTGQSENDSYVSYNYREQTWAIGAMGRSAGVDKGVFEHPIYVASPPDTSSASVFYEHELGEVRSDVPTAYAESGHIELKDTSGDGLGFEIARVQRYIPDGKTFAQGLNDSLDDVRLKFFSSLYPESDEKTDLPYIALANPTNLRFSGRYVRMRVEEVNGVRWRFGIPHVGILPAGRR